MGLFDKAKDAAQKAVDQHGDKIRQGADKLGHVIDERTGHKHTDKINQGKRKLEDALDGMDGKNDDIRDRPASPEPPGRPDGPATS